MKIYIDCIFLRFFVSDLIFMDNLNNPTILTLKTYGQITVAQSQVHTYNTHAHVYNEMLVYEPFDGYITINNEKFIIDTPTVALINTSNFHSTHLSGVSDASCMKISFADNMMSDYFAQTLNCPIVLKDYKTNPFIDKLIAKLSTTENNKNYKEVILNSILLELCENGRKVQAISKMNINRLVTEAINILNHHFNEDITLNNVADDLGITPQYLSYIFSKNMNVSFSNYLTDIRLQYAAGILLDKTLSVTDACYLSGYQNLSHFVRSFKRKYNLSPGEYKKLN